VKVTLRGSSADDAAVSVATDVEEDVRVLAELLAPIPSPRKR
jgi:hypothetical protein